MINETASIIMSFCMLAFASASYFFKSKSAYLLLQGIAVFCLTLSYFFLGEYFAMTGMFIGLARTAVYYLYERRNARVPVIIVVGVCTLTLANYFIINFKINQSASPFDVLFLIACCLYAVIFSIRNLKIVRYTILIPIAISIAYNLLIKAPIFAVVNYVVEFSVGIFTIFYFYYFKKKTSRN